MSSELIGFRFGEREVRDRINHLLKYFQRVQKKRIKTVTADYTITLEDHTILVDATSAAVTITLPKAYNAFEYIFNVKKIDSTANTVTIDGDGAETIDDSTTQIITTQYDCVTVQSDKTEYWIL